MKHLIALLMITAAPARADIVAAVQDHVLPAYANFATQSASLRDAAATDCSIAAVRPAWNTAFDAWTAISYLRLGPVEEAGRYSAIAFWPDERSATPKALKALISTSDPIIVTPAGVAELSVAARGFYAMELLLYGDEFAQETPYSCALIRALATDLAAVSQAVSEEWSTGYGDLLVTAGAPDNPSFKSSDEGYQALFTALLSGLEFTADAQLGRPLGTFDRPRPKQAEAWRSGRAQRNVLLSLQTLADLKARMVDAPTPLTDAGFAKVIKLAQELKDPTFVGVTEPGLRLKIEILQQSVFALRDVMLTEVGAVLGVSAGFNAADGD